MIVILAEKRLVPPTTDESGGTSDSESPPSRPTTPWTVLNLLDDVQSEFTTHDECESVFTCHGVDTTSKSFSTRLLVVYGTPTERKLKDKNTPETSYVEGPSNLLSSVF